MLTFEEIYTTYAADVYRFSRWLCADSTEAEDITSETFVRAWTRSTGIHTETLKAYLFTIARNTYLEHQRKSKRQVVMEDVYTDPKPGPDQALTSKLELQQVQHFLRSLPEIDRTAFVMRLQHELSYAEIARALEISEVAAKVKVHRVRKKLITARIKEEV